MANINPPVFTYSNFVFISSTNENNDNKFKFKINNPTNAVTNTINYKYWSADQTESAATSGTISLTAGDTDVYGISSFILTPSSSNTFYRIKIATNSANPTGEQAWSDVVLFKRDGGLAVSGGVEAGRDASKDPLTVVYNITQNGSTDTITQYRITVTPSGSSNIKYDSGIIINNKYDKIIHNIYDNFYSFNDTTHTINFNYTTAYGVTGSLSTSCTAGTNPTAATENELVLTTNNEQGVIKVTAKVAGKLFKSSDNYNYMYLSDIAANTTYIDRLVDDSCSYKYILVAGTNTYYISNTISLNFENDFITDKDNQLILKFNKDLSNYRQSFVSASQTTIGSQYPFVRRMAANNYKTFNVGGLITYQNESFDTELDFTDSTINNTKAYLKAKESRFHNDNVSFSDWASVVFQGTLPSGADAEVKKERLFRDKVIEFLSRDTVKLFRSSTEGLILVSLKDISLTPEKQLGRQVYSFTASATEVAPVNQQSLERFGFIK